MTKWSSDYCTTFVGSFDLYQTVHGSFGRSIKSEGKDQTFRSGFFWLLSYLFMVYCVERGHIEMSEVRRVTLRSVCNVKVDVLWNTMEFTQIKDCESRVCVCVWEGPFKDGQEVLSRVCMEKRCRKGVCVRRVVCRTQTLVEEVS